MAKVLISFQADYADEFDVYGWGVRTEEYWKAFIANAIKWFEDNPGKELAFWFGGNECIEWDNSGDFLASFETKSITDEEADALKTIWEHLAMYPRDGMTYGHFCEPREFFDK